MKSTPGSARATPLHGQVKLVPSIRNWFSLVPEPNADTVVAVPLARRRRRDARGGPDEVEHARPSRRDRFEILGAEAGSEPRVSCFDARARSLDRDRFREAAQRQNGRSLDGGACADADVLFAIGRESRSSMSSTYGPGGRAGKRSWPFSFVVCVAGPPISAGEPTRTTAPERTPPCSSLTVPMREPVRPCATAARGRNNATPARSTKQHRVREGVRPRHSVSM